MIEAALGDRDNAVKHGERAVQLVPVERDAINGPLLVQYLSIIYSWTGQKDLAIKQLKRYSDYSKRHQLWAAPSASFLG